MDQTTTSVGNDIEPYCNICKASKGHYTKDHEAWAEVDDIIKEVNPKLEADLEKTKSWLWKAIPDATPGEMIEIGKKSEGLAKEIQEMIEKENCKPSEAAIKVTKKHIDLMRKKE